MNRDREIRPAWQRYGVAILSVAVAAVLRSEYLLPLGTHSPFVTFYPAVIIAALYGGGGAGLLATLLSTILAMLRMEPISLPYATRIADLLSLVIFFFSGGVLSYICEAMYRAQARANEAETQARLAAEQERAAAVLRKNEEKLLLALDAAQMGTWDWDITAGELVWSDRCRSMFGVDPEESVSFDRFLDAVYPEDRGRIELAVRKSLEMRELYEEEMRVIRPDGTLRWVMGKGRAYFSDSGKATRMSGMVLDVTERKQMEIDLVRSRDEWERTFDSVSDMIMITDNHSMLVRANRALAERLGVTPEEIAGLHCYEVLHDSTRQPAFCPHAQLLRDGKEHVFEIHEDRLGGDFVLSLTPLLGEEGEVLGVVHVLRDITESKRMREALEKRLVALTRPLDSAEGLAFEDLFNLEEIQTLQDKFAEACGVASIITRVDGTPITRPSNFCRLCSDIIRASPKGRENCHCSDALIGRHNPEGPNIQPCLSGGLWDAGASITVGGKHIANWLVGQVRNETQNESNMRLYARKIGVDEEELVSAFREVPSMNIEQFELVAQALFTLAGELSTTAYQNVQQARFITDLERMEEEVRRSRDELELRVHERTAQLEEINRQLVMEVEERKRAEDALMLYARKLEQQKRELEDFAFISSHHVQEPLRKILTFSGKIKTRCQDSIDHEAEDYIRRLHKSVGRIQAIMQDLLRYSRVGSETEGFRPVDLFGIVQEVIAGLDRSVRETGARVEVGELPGIDADRKQMLKLFSHLIDNALKFRGENAPVVKIYSKVKNNDGGEVVEIYVEDNGIGFDEIYLDKIFTPFQQLHAKAVYEGTGMGLAICRRIVELHGGSITARSSHGEGATFIISLPVHQEIREELP